MGGVLAAGEAGELGGPRCRGAGQGRGPRGRGRAGRRRRLRQVTAAPGFQACDAWQREAKEAKERALAADSARQLALQKKEEVEAQFRRLQEELEGRGLASALPGLSGCGDIGAIPLPKLHSLQSQLRLDLEAVDGVSPGSSSRNQRAEHRGGVGGRAQLPSTPHLPSLSHCAPPPDRGHVAHIFGSPSRILGHPLL